MSYLHCGPRRRREPSDVWRMLGWMSVVAGVAAGMLLLRHAGTRRQSREPLAAQREESLDDTIESSFPASDPPSSW